MEAAVRRFWCWGIVGAAVLLLWGCGLYEEYPKSGDNNAEQNWRNGRSGNSEQGLWDEEGRNTNEDWQAEENGNIEKGQQGEKSRNKEADWQSGENITAKKDGKKDKSHMIEQIRQYGPDKNTKEDRYNRKYEIQEEGNRPEITSDGGQKPDADQWSVLVSDIIGQSLYTAKQRNRKLRQERISQILEGDIDLPVSYDARKEGRAAPVKDQKGLGTCWAFSSLLALENSLLPTEEWDFSEDHMSHNPNFILGQENGGEYTMSMAYLLAWQGPVTEEQDPYGDGVSPQGLEPVKHVQEIQILPEKEFEVIKRAVLACGGVQSSLYTTMQNGQSRSEYYNPDTSAYCYPKERAPNHDVVIVGWDDDFPKEAFRGKAAGNGAFLCENSWGTEFGEEGFFYVSYYDENLGRTNIVYTAVEDSDNFDLIYQSDLCGWVGQMGYGEDTAWAANVYTAAGREQVEAVGFYATDQNTAYQVYVIRYVPDNAAPELKNKGNILAEGELRNAGYYTISLKEPVHVEPGERFAVMVRLTTPGTVHPIAIEYDAENEKSDIDLSDGEGYISYEGRYWGSAEEKQGCNICLKAYTRRR